MLGRASLWVWLLYVIFCIITFVAGTNDSAIVLGRALGSLTNIIVIIPALAGSALFGWDWRNLVFSLFLAGLVEAYAAYGGPRYSFGEFDGFNIWFFLITVFAVLTVSVVTTAVKKAIKRVRRAV